eukprot:2979305-Prymnesium_polylepis.1
MEGACAAGLSVCAVAEGRRRARRRASERMWTERKTRKKRAYMRGVDRNGRNGRSRGNTGKKPRPLPPSHGAPNALMIPLRPSPPSRRPAPPRTAASTRARPRSPTRSATRGGSPASLPR